MTWQQLTIILSEKISEQVADLLQEQGALSISFEDAGDEEVFQLSPGDNPLWSHIKIVALFSKETVIDSITQTLREILKNENLEVTITDIEDQDWVRETQKNFPPQCFAENLWVLPSWCERSHYIGAKISIDPGLAFGTGAHPTTNLCLQWLAKNSIENKTVIDYGCGSGILALGALALGAKEVFAIDHDPQALEATANNARLNDFDKQKLHILTVEDSIPIKADIILANILAQPLISLASTLGDLSNDNAILVLSGILSKEVEKLVKAYAEFFKAISTTSHEGWACLVLKR